MTTYPVHYADIAAYRKWRGRRIGPAYLRGIPSWMWETAARGQNRPGRAASAVT
jgi:hypothetical protein